MAKRERVHQTLTPQQVRESKAGAEVLSPGVWIDRRGGLHFSLPEILRELGLPDTPADREMLTQMIVEMMARVSPGAPIIETDVGTDG